MTSAFTTCIDQVDRAPARRARHEVRGILGEGAQGTVYRVRTGRLKVKLLQQRTRVATSGDVPGLATEADTSESLIGKLRVMIPELLEANGEERLSPRVG